jgi:hypothetical protein
MKGRVKRGAPPKKVLTDGNLRKYALPSLLRDFESRCAYSMQHRRRAGGAKMLMEIDHFDPRIRGRNRHQYQNLFLSSRFCNARKHENWPEPAEVANGVRFLNCCEEFDYGKHIFEDEKTHCVFGVTPAGKYHIRILDLNAPHLVKERAERAHYRRLLYEARKLVKQPEAAVMAFRVLKEQVNYLIPEIAYATPPVGFQCPGAVRRF